MEIRIILNDETRVISKIKVIEYGFDTTIYTLKGVDCEDTINEIIKKYDSSGDKREYEKLL